MSGDSHLFNSCGVVNMTTARKKATKKKSAVRKKSAARKKSTVQERAAAPVTQAGVKTAVDNVIEGYSTQLGTVMSEHNELLENSRREMEALVSKSNEQLAKLSTELNKQAALAQSTLEGEAVEEVKPKPETAWVKDHLVLNPEAVAMINDLFDKLQDLLPEIAKLVKPR